MWAGFSNTNQEINLNYRDAPPCRREASLFFNFNKPAAKNENLAVIKNEFIEITNILVYF
jgi:hypothetical protein